MVELKLLSILIPTLPKRLKLLEELILSINEQITSFIEIVTDDREKPTTGEKRNDLLRKAKGKYVVFIDDDDHVSSDYVESLMEGIVKDVDIVTFNGWMTTNGKDHMDFEIKLGNPYDKLGRLYRRFPNHLACVKREIALKVGFPNLSFGEDYDYAKRLQDHLRTSYHIERHLYHYDFKTNR